MSQSRDYTAESEAFVGGYVAAATLYEQRARERGGEHMLTAVIFAGLGIAVGRWWGKNHSS